MAKQHEIHKYTRVNIGKKDKEYYVYKCVIAGCTHYLPHKNLLTGRESICHQCDNTFIIKKDIAIREINKPRCDNCRKGGPKNLRKNKPEVKQVEPKSVDNAIELLTQGLFTIDK